MRTTSYPPIAPSEITPQSAYLSRRAAMATGLAAFASPVLAASGTFSTDEPKTSLKDVASYNNFYEFGTDKTEPAQLAHRLTTSPWTIEVDGLVHKPQRFGLDWLLKKDALEERVYRMRCVEGWSMVIPWQGFPLSRLINAVEPQGSAKFIRFETLMRPSEMPGQASSRIIAWPYIEALRLDEAMHPLTLLAVGLYGEALPKQNGAPVRLVVPWKYGFKGIKSIVKISFVEERPKSSWEMIAPDEYGFYANVNPGVDHPRWSQATERRIGESGLFVKRRPTLMFNGYGEQVASLYAGLDLKTNY